MSEYDVFLTHTWLNDELGRNNHERVTIINEELKKRGYITWFDSDRMVGHIAQQMAEGIEQANSVIVFLTKKYVNKVTGDNSSDNCQLEFKFATRIKSSAKIVPVLMESGMRNKTNWKGIVGLHLFGKMYIDMSGDLNGEEYLAKQMDALEKELEGTGVMKKVAMHKEENDKPEASNKSSIRWQEKRRFRTLTLKFRIRISDLSVDVLSTDAVRIEWTGDTSEVYRIETRLEFCEMYKIFENTKKYPSNEWKMLQLVKEKTSVLVELDKPWIYQYRITNVNDDTDTKEDDVKGLEKYYEFYNMTFEDFERILQQNRHREFFRIIDGFPEKIDLTGGEDFGGLFHMVTDPEVLKELIKRKREGVKCTDSKGNTPLHTHAANINVECIQILLNNGADIEATNNKQETPLLAATEAGNYNAIDWLITQNASILAKDNLGNTALHLTTKNGYTDCSKLLLHYSVDINEVNNVGNTALHIAAQSGNTKCVELLLNRLADETKKNRWNETAFDQAKKHDHNDCIRLLSKGQNEADGADNNGNIPVETKKSKSTRLLKAFQRNDKETIDILLKEDIDLDVTDAYGETLLHLAARKGLIDYIDILLEKGADILAKNEEMQTPFDVACDDNCVFKFEREEIKKLLKPPKRKSFFDIFFPKERRW